MPCVIIIANVIIAITILSYHMWIYAILQIRRSIIFDTYEILDFSFSHIIGTLYILKIIVMHFFKNNSLKCFSNYGGSVIIHLL